MTFCASEVTVIVPQSNCAPKIPPQMLSKPQNAVFQLGKKRGVVVIGYYTRYGAFTCLYVSVQRLLSLSSMLSSFLFWRGN